MRLLDDLTSRDPKRIWEAACAIRKLRDHGELTALAAALDQIKISTKGVDLGGMLRPNSSHLNFAIRKLEFVRDRSDCLCELYTQDDMYDPEHEAAEGNVVLTDSRVSDDGWVEYYACRCSLCGAKFRVEPREYHYTWWEWQRFTAD